MNYANNFPRASAIAFFSARKSRIRIRLAPGEVHNVISSKTLPPESLHKAEFHNLKSELLSKSGVHCR